MQIEAQNRQNNIEKENKLGRLTLSNFKTQYKATVINTVWYWIEDRYIDKLIESLKINPYTYDYLIFDKGVKTT